MPQGLVKNGALATNNRHFEDKNMSGDLSKVEPLWLVRRLMLTHKLFQTNHHFISELMGHIVFRLGFDFTLL